MHIHHHWESFSPMVGISNNLNGEVSDLDLTHMLPRKFTWCGPHRKKYSIHQTDLCNHVSGDCPSTAQTITKEQWVTSVPTNENLSWFVSNRENSFCKAWATEKVWKWDTCHTELKIKGQRKWRLYYLNKPVHSFGFLSRGTLNVRVPEICSDHKK